MDIDKYQQEAFSTNIYPTGRLGFYAMTLGLCGESGEFADKVKKVIRDSDGQISIFARQELALELGDVLWYASQIADCLGYDLSEIAQLNLDKLKSRAERNTIGGSGDVR